MVSKKLRDCLKCGESFVSKNFGKRFCKKCNPIPEELSPSFTLPQTSRRIVNGGRRMMKVLSGR